MLSHSIVNEYNDGPNFSSNQWTLIKYILLLLKPFKDITETISSSESLISEVIPMVIMSKKYLMNSADVLGIEIMKDCLQKNADAHFRDGQLK